MSRILAAIGPVQGAHRALGLGPCLDRVRRAHRLSPALDRVGLLEDEHVDGTGRHELNQAIEEGLPLVLSVEALGLGLGKSDHLVTDNNETSIPDELLDVLRARTIGILVSSARTRRVTGIAPPA